jgi:hypothetical protein
METTDNNTAIHTCYFTCQREAIIGIWQNEFLCIVIQTDQITTLSSHMQGWNIVLLIIVDPKPCLKIGTFIQNVKWRFFSSIKFLAVQYIDTNKTAGQGNRCFIDQTYLNCIKNKILVVLHSMKSLSRLIIIDCMELKYWFTLKLWIFGFHWYHFKKQWYELGWSKGQYHVFFFITDISF